MKDYFFHVNNLTDNELRVFCCFIFGQELQIDTIAKLSKQTGISCYRVSTAVCFLKIKKLLEKKQ